MSLKIKFLTLALLGIFVSVGAFAQVTTSSLSGKVTDESGSVVGATIVAVHQPSGTQYYSVSNNEGRYSIQGMRPGGPYEIKVTMMGYQTVAYQGITLSLAEGYTQDANLTSSTEVLEEIVIVADRATRFATEKTGASTNINNKQISELPTISRSITDITKLSPYGGNGMTFAGTDGRTANFTVDGANFNNNFGLSSNLPGGGSPISIDAIEEVQVVISPYDIRQTNFIGGGVNAITKSGTNTFKGSAYIYHRNENMRGNTVDGTEMSGARDKDRTTTYGATLGGPIIKNKLFFFANFEYSVVPTVVNRWKPSTDGQANPDSYISRTTQNDMQTVSDFLKSKYGYETGSYMNFPADESNMKMLGRLDWNINNNHKIALRYNYTLNRGWNATNSSSSNCAQRTTQARMSQYAMAFANSMYSADNKVSTWSLDYNGRFSDNLSNQFLATYSELDDVRGTNSSKFPFIDILDGTGVFPYMSAGYELFTWNNGVHNRVLTAKDDITFVKGNHKLVAGISYEYQMADNSYMRNGTGYYRYNSMNDFLSGAAPETVALTYGYDGELNPAARVTFHKAAVYAQDEWTPTPKFKLTYGIHVGTIIFDNKDIMRNQAIYNLDFGGKQIDTGVWPSPKIQLSPRVGFSWDVMGNKSLKVRGGTGLFTGRLPLVFFTNMPTGSGMVQNVAAITTTYQNGVANPDPMLASFAGGMITDVDELIKKMNSLDPNKFPTSISPEKGVVPSEVVGVEKSFKMPQVWKSSIAVDYAFPVSFPMSLSGEFIFNKTINGVYIQDYNMMSTEGFARLNGADNRHIFPSNYKYVANVTAPVLSNTNKGYGYLANVTFTIRPIESLNITAAYTHTVSKELTGMPGSNATSAFTYIPTIDGPNNPSLHNSEYVTPDRAFASLTYSDRGNNHYSIFYEAFRGGYNYSFMYANDLNGDNYNYDAIYIPKDDSEIRFASTDDAARYWEFANNNDYLNSHKGEYAEAYSVYSPWVHRLDFRFAHDFKVNIGKSSNTLQLNVDFKNVLNLFNSSWGVSKYMNPALNSGRILKMERIDSDGVPVFSTPSAVQQGVETWLPYKAIGQCWYMQVGIKYMFN